MRRAVPTTSIAIAFHVVMAVMIFTARPSKPSVASISKSDDVVEVGSMMDRAAATESSADEGATIVPSAGGGAVLVAPRGNVASAMRAAPHVVEAAPAKEIAIAPAPAEVPTVAIMPPRAVGIGGSNILLPPAKKPVAEATPVASVDRVVTASIEDAARSATGANGRAVFVVKAEAKEGDCSVVAVDLVERDGSGWDEARRVAYERLKGKKVSVPAGTKLALLSIEVTSGVSLPDDALVGRRGDNDMPELVLPDISGGAHRVVASRVVKTTYL